MTSRGILAGFGPTLLFAAASALAAPMALAALRPIAGGSGALTLYALATLCTYAAGLATDATRALGAALVVGGSGLALLFGGVGVHATLLVTTVLLGVVRSGWLRRDTRRPGARSFARAFATEASVIGGGLLLARLLAAGSFFPISLGLWGFFLCQSAFFLIGGPTEGETAARHSAPSGGDAFETAARRAQSLLEARPSA